MLMRPALSRLAAYADHTGCSVTTPERLPGAPVTLELPGASVIWSNSISCSCLMTVSGVPLLSLPPRICRIAWLASEDSGSCPAAAVSLPGASTCSMHFRPAAACASCTGTATRGLACSVSVCFTPGLGWLTTLICGSYAPACIATARRTSCGPGPYTLACTALSSS